MSVMRRLTMTQKEQARVMTLNLVLEGGLGVAGAAGIMGLSERPTWRILSAYRQQGAARITPGNRGEATANASSSLSAGAYATGRRTGTDGRKLSRLAGRARAVAHANSGR